MLFVKNLIPSIPKGQLKNHSALVNNAIIRIIISTKTEQTFFLLLSPLIQFNLLHSKFHLCSVPTRALLLSTYIKFVNLFPEIKTTIQDVLRSDSQLKNADVELQQRAVEYLRLSTIASTDILVGIEVYFLYYAVLYQQVKLN